MKPARTQPKIWRPGLLKARPSCSVAVTCFGGKSQLGMMYFSLEAGKRTKAVFGKTKENQVIWKGILALLSGRRYFQSEPTETRKNQMLSPQSQSPVM